MAKRRNYITTKEVPAYTVKALKLMLFNAMANMAEMEEVRKVLFYKQDVWALMAAPAETTLESCKHLGLVPSNAKISI